MASMPVVRIVASATCSVTISPTASISAVAVGCGAGGCGPRSRRPAWWWAPGPAEPTPDQFEQRSDVERGAAQNRRRDREAREHRPHHRPFAARAALHQEEDTQRGEQHADDQTGDARAERACWAVGEQASASSGFTRAARSAGTTATMVASTPTPKAMPSSAGTAIVSPK